MGNKKSEMLVIVNKRASLVELPGRPHEDTEKKHAFWKDCDNPELIVGKKLLPGENSVPSDYWDAIKGHKAVKMLLAVKILKNKGVGKARSLADGLDALEKHEAIKQIHKCTSTQILNDWAKKTSDSGLSKRCKARIGELIEDQGKEEVSE